MIESVDRVPSVGKTSLPPEFNVRLLKVRLEEVRLATAPFPMERLPEVGKFDKGVFVPFRPPLSAITTEGPFATLMKIVPAPPAALTANPPNAETSPVNEFVAR
jgi:hypothetical protein